MAMVDRLKAEQAHAVEDNQRLARELEAMRVRMNSTETMSAELAALRVSATLSAHESSTCSTSSRRSIYERPASSCQPPATH